MLRVWDVWSWGRDGQKILPRMKLIDATFLAEFAALERSKCWFDAHVVHTDYRAICREQVSSDSHRITPPAT